MATTYRDILFTLQTLSEDKLDQEALIIDNTGVVELRFNIRAVYVVNTSYSAEKLGLAQDSVFFEIGKI